MSDTSKFLYMPASALASRRIIEESSYTTTPDQSSADGILSCGEAVVHEKSLDTEKMKAVDMILQMNQSSNDDGFEPSTEKSQPEQDFIYHLMLLKSHLNTPNVETEKFRILGTYKSPAKAKDAAHRCLFEGGYEREWFPTFETKPEVLEGLAESHGTGLVVYAVAADDTVFRVCISTSPNNLYLTTDNEDGRIPLPLYYAVQTTVPYCNHGRKPAYDTHIEGTFKSLAEAREFASTLLLSAEHGITASSYQEYCEADPTERDCGYGENVIVHAIGDSGQNYLVSVIMCQELESVRLAEASFRIP
jgi:hypothetical protein